MPAPRMERTRTPGVFKRGGRYVAVYRINGKQRKEYARTLEEARRIRSARLADRDRGEFQEQSRIRFRDYATEWVERYQGNGRRGFTEDTRDDYRRDLARYAYPYFDDQLGRTLTTITPRDVANWIGWICDADEQGRRLELERREHVMDETGSPAAPKPHKPKPLADATVRRILAPLRSCLATARREGLIRHNPADGAVLPRREEVQEDGEQIRALTREQLRAFLAIVHPDHRLMFRFLAVTGLRWSELAELRWRDLVLDGSGPCVKVRRAIVRGKVKAPKSKYGKRDVPLDAGLVSELRQHRGDPDRLVFPSKRGVVLDYSNARRRMLLPAAEEAGAPWAGFHTFRHTCASLLFERGANAVQVQRWLGHHSPSFTLATYVHLMDGGVGDGLDLDAELAEGNGWATHPTGLHRNNGAGSDAEKADLREIPDSTELHRKVAAPS